MFDNFVKSVQFYTFKLLLCTQFGPELGKNLGEMSLFVICVEPFCCAWVKMTHLNRLHGSFRPKGSRRFSPFGCWTGCFCRYLTVVALGARRTPAGVSPVFRSASGTWPPRSVWVWTGTCSAWTGSPAPGVADWWRRCEASDISPTGRTEGPLQEKRPKVIHLGGGGAGEPDFKEPKRFDGLNLRGRKWFYKSQMSLPDPMRRCQPSFWTTKDMRRSVTLWGTRRQGGRGDTYASTPCHH